MFSTKRLGLAVCVAIAAGSGCNKKKTGDAGAASGSAGSGSASGVSAAATADAAGVVVAPPPPPPAPIDAAPAAVAPPPSGEPAAYAALPAPPEACEADACTKLAGSQAPASLERAAFFKQGCATGDGEACGRLATTFEEGLGVAENLKTAVWLHDKACGMKLATSCQTLGVILLYGKGRPPTGIDADPERGAALLDEACKAQHWPSCIVLADYYMSSDERDRALRIYRVACDHKHQPACDALAKVQ